MNNRLHALFKPFITARNSILPVHRQIDLSIPLCDAAKPDFYQLVNEDKATSHIATSCHQSSNINPNLKVLNILRYAYGQGQLETQGASNQFTFFEIRHLGIRTSHLIMKFTSLFIPADPSSCANVESNQLLTSNPTIW